MKRILLVLLIGWAGLACAQQSEERNVGTFKGVKAAEGIDVYLKKGDQERVKVEVSGNLDVADVITEVSGSYLKIHMRETRFLRNVNVKVYVTYVSLNKLSASSAANIYAEGVLTSDDLEIGVSSAGSVELSIKVNNLEVGVSSAGDVELEGSAKSAYFDISSAGEVDAYDVQAERVIVKASSAGSAKVSVEKDFEAHASSGASIRYKGNPAKSMTNSSSGGSVKKSY